MKAVIQRSKKASVSVDGKLVNEIPFGFVILLGIHVEDTEEDIDYLVKKIINLRIFDDEAGVMNRSIQEVKGSILSISQFTLQANTKKGNRPSYMNAMTGEKALPLYEEFNDKLKEYVPTYSGVFGAEMLITLENDGPITIILDSKDR